MWVSNGISKDLVRFGCVLSCSIHSLENVGDHNLLDSGMWQKPKWQPPTVEDVTLPDVLALFEKFENPIDELEVPAPTA